MLVRSLMAATLFAATARADADEYLLTVSAVGFADVPQSEPDPPEQPLDSAEVLCRPGEPFRAKASVGPTTMTLSGKLRPAEDGRFSIDLLYSRTNDTGQTVPTDHGEKKVLDVSSSRSSVLVRLGEPFEWGGGVTRRSDRIGTTDERHTKSTRRVVLLLRKFEPAELKNHDPLAE